MISGCDSSLSSPVGLIHGWRSHWKASCLFGTLVRREKSQPSRNHLCPTASCYTSTLVYLDPRTSVVSTSPLGHRGLGLRWSPPPPPRRQAACCWSSCLALGTTVIPIMFSLRMSSTTVVSIHSCAFVFVWHLWGLVTLIHLYLCLVSPAILRAAPGPERMPRVRSSRRAKERHGTSLG